jgi:hypothetical protein
VLRSMSCIEALMKPTRTLQELRHWEAVAVSALIL